MKPLLFLTAIFAFPIGAALADCPDSPPSIDWNIQSGDQHVSGDYLADLLVGNKVRYDDGGTENYRTNGKYVYKLGSSTYKADDFRFYPDGVRCIGYPNFTRFDRYVVREGALWMIADGGSRFKAQVTN